MQSGCSYQGLLSSEDSNDAFVFHRIAELKKAVEQNTHFHSVLVNRPNSAQRQAVRRTDQSRDCDDFDDHDYFHSLSYDSSLEERQLHPSRFHTMSEYNTADSGSGTESQHSQAHSTESICEALRSSLFEKTIEYSELSGLNVNHVASMLSSSSILDRCKDDDSRHKALVRLHSSIDNLIIKYRARQQERW
jgi:hypothetical protein